MTPLELLESQIAANPGRELVAIRIHPADWPVLVDELRRLGFRTLEGLPAHRPLGGVPVVEDGQLVEGLVAEFRDRVDLDRAVETIVAYLGDRP